MATLVIFFIGVIELAIAISGLHAIITRQTLGRFGRVVKGKEAVFIGWMRILVVAVSLIAMLLHMFY